MAKMTSTSSVVLHLGRKRHSLPPSYFQKIFGTDCILIDKPLMRAFSISKSKNRFDMTSTFKHLVVRNAACEASVWGQGPSLDDDGEADKPAFQRPKFRTTYGEKQYKAKVKKQAIQSGHCHGMVDVTMPQIECKGTGYGPVTFKTPFTRLENCPLWVVCVGLALALSSMSTFLR